MLGERSTHGVGRCGTTENEVLVHERLFGRGLSRHGNEPHEDTCVSTDRMKRADYIWPCVYTTLGLVISLSIVLILFLQKQPVVVTRHTLVGVEVSFVVKNNAITMVNTSGHEIFYRGFAKDRPILDMMIRNEGLISYPLLGYCGNGLKIIRLESGEAISFPRLHYGVSDDGGDEVCGVELYGESNYVYWTDGSRILANDVLRWRHDWVAAERRRRQRE